VFSHMAASTGMTEALRAQIKEQLIANNLCSDTGNTTDVETATNNTATAVSASLDAMRLDGAKATDTPPMAAHKSVSATLASHPVCKFCVLTASYGTAFCIAGPTCAIETRGGQSFPRCFHGYARNRHRG
jgi:hypothetical protein